MSGFDASIGLAASLEICRYYKYSGTLKASVKGIRVLRGLRRIEIIVQNGVVTSCLLQNLQGQEERGDIKQLIEQTNKLSYGEIAWVFTLTSSSTSSRINTPSQLRWGAIPKRVVPALTPHHLQNYTANQQRLLLAVFSKIDGLASFETLALQNNYPRSLFEQVVIALLQLHTISYT